MGLVKVQGALIPLARSSCHHKAPTPRIALGSPPRVADCRGDGRVCRDGVDRDEGAFESVLHGEPFKQCRDGDELVCGFRDRFLAENVLSRWY